MLKIQTLSSGSAGNITYIGSTNTNILVDIGLSLSTTLKLMAQAQIRPETINGILITHEHSDHLKGVADFVLKYDKKIYCYPQTVQILKRALRLPPQFFVVCEPGFCIGEITVNCFPIPHDSQFCLGYTFSSGENTVGIATDIGQMTPTIISQLSACQIVILESNHDIDMLRANKKYPEWLKRRILGNRGHLSNLDSGRTIARLYQSHVGQIILAHLSEKNNTPALAYQTVKQYLQSQGIREGTDIFVDVALQSQIGNCYCLE